MPGATTLNKSSSAVGDTMVVEHDALTSVKTESHQVLRVLQHLSKFAKGWIKSIHFTLREIKYIGHVLTGIDTDDLDIIRV